MIYENDVKDPVKATEAYRQFTAAYPGHELTALARTRLEKLQAGTKGCQKI
jgi:hypothetical protein